MKNTTPSDFWNISHLFRQETYLLLTYINLALASLKKRLTITPYMAEDLLVHQVVQVALLTQQDPVDPRDKAQQTVIRSF